MRSKFWASICVLRVDSLTVKEIMAETLTTHRGFSIGFSVFDNRRYCRQYCTELMLYCKRPVVFLEEVLLPQVYALSSPAI
jgi:hypothetical protein